MMEVFVTEAELGAGDLVAEIWERHADADLKRAEGRTLLDRALKRELGRIDDPGLRNHCAAMLRARRSALYRPERDWRMEKLERRQCALEARIELLERRMAELGNG